MRLLDEPTPEREGAVAGADERGGLREAAEHRVVEGGILELQVDQALQPRARGGLRVDGRLEGEQLLAGDGRDHRVDERLAGAHAVVERADADTGGARDVLQGGRGRAR
ncbi:hypothetical protein LRE50_10530 [Clavibacter sepedonicus]|nr:MULTISPECIES: hypothetical protein [Clavibacter]UUK64723.1 hypothetical protein LRE50_10530 [Clavibacter sepedonicus]